MSPHPPIPDPRAASGEPPQQPRSDACPAGAEWVENPALDQVPPQLLVTPGLSWRDRLAALRRRHLLRGERARAFYAGSRNPDRGLPVAGNGAAWTFVTRLLRTRKGMLALVVGTNLAAAMAGLVVPWMLGLVVDQVAGVGSAGRVDPILSVICLLYTSRCV